MDTVRVWDDIYSNSIHVGDTGKNLELIIDRDDSITLNIDGVRKLRRALQRWERNSTSTESMSAD